MICGGRSTHHLVVVLMAFLVASCARDDVRMKEADPDDHAGHDSEHRGEVEAVHLDEGERSEFGVEVALATRGVLRVEVKLPGEVVPNADLLAHIVPRFPGLVKQVSKDIGDRVEKGELLAVIESNESLSPYEVRSLTEGTVIEKHITIGELIKEDVYAFVIADLRSVWVNLRVYQKDLAHVRKGQRVLVVAGHGIPDATGVVSYVAPVVDEITRTALSRVVLANGAGLWRPGLFVTGTVSIDEITVPLMLPKSALVTFEGETSVFVETPDGFTPRAVTTGRSDATSLEIVSGLTAGESCVVKGAFTLKAELSKAAFGDGHAH